MATEVNLGYCCGRVLGISCELHLQDIPVDLKRICHCVKKSCSPDEGGLQSDKVLLGQAAWGRGVLKKFTVEMILVQTLIWREQNLRFGPNTANTKAVFVGQIFISSPARLIPRHTNSASLCLPQTVTNCHRLLQTARDFHRLPQLSKVAKSCQKLSKVPKILYKFS